MVKTVRDKKRLQPTQMEKDIRHWEMVLEHMRIIEGRGIQDYDKKIYCDEEMPRQRMPKPK